MSGEEKEDALVADSAVFQGMPRTSPEYSGMKMREYLGGLDIFSHLILR